MNVEEIRLLYDFNSWANQRTREACAQLSPNNSRRGWDRASARCATRWHIFWAPSGFGWNDGRAARRRCFPKAADFPDFVPRAALGGNRARVGDVHRVAEAGRFGSRAALQDHGRHADGGPLWQMLQHLVNHGSYHRGQVATLLRQLGAKPNSTDLIGYYRELGMKAKASAIARALRARSP